MKKLIGLLLFGIVGLGVAWLATWKIIIQPQNTRLALYEALTASKDSRNASGDQLLTWLDEFNGLEIDHFKPCEKIQYFNQNATLNRRLETIEAAEVNRALPLSSLQKAARGYLPETLSLQDLTQIGEAEFEIVMSELRQLETELTGMGLDLTLDELAAQPKNFSSDPADVKRIYTQFILKGEQTLTPRFYPYNIPATTVKISETTHRFNAYAQYDPNRNAMTAYFDEEQYDLSIVPFISIHEIFPGHHLSAKAGLSNPLCAGDSPALAGWLGEGWATYIEFLADEDDFFETPEDKLAWLDYRLTRAMRIILDVKRMQGVTDYDHLKWFWDERMPTRLAGRFDPEFKRIRNSRHQHLGYIFGSQAIFDAKRKLREDLGKDFDEKKFHDVILRLEHKEVAAFYDTVRVAMDIAGDPQITLEN